MTQIVYDGEYLYADRKAYTYDRFSGETKKLKTVSNNEITLVYAFCGSYLDCAIGELVVESFFDPKVCKDARERLSAESLELFWGLVVEIRKDQFVSNEHKVFTVNYAGDKCEMVKGEFIALGRMSDAIMIAHSAVKRFSDTIVCTEDLIRFVTNNTTQHQNDYVIDRVKLGVF